jgi:hypothetical protein
MMHDVPVDSRCAASWFVLAAPLLACPIDDLSEGLHDASTPRDVTVLEGSTRLDVRAQDTGPRADAGHDAGRPYMGLFDGKSFQGLKLNDDVRGYGYASGSGSGGYCDIVSIVDGGRDLVYGNTEPRSPYTGKTPNGPVGIWGGSAAYADTMQLDSNAPSDFTRAIVDAAVPTGVSHRVLQLTFATPNEDSVGGVMDNNDFNIFSSYTSPDDIVSTLRWTQLFGPERPAVKVESASSLFFVCVSYP